MSVFRKSYMLSLFTSSTISSLSVSSFPKKYSADSFLFSRGGTCLRTASEGSPVGTQTVWRDTFQQPGKTLTFLRSLHTKDPQKSKLKVFKPPARPGIFKKLSISHLSLCLCYVCSFSSSNWQKWPPSWLRLAFWCVRLRQRCRRTGPMRFPSAPWPSSLQQMSALM